MGIFADEFGPLTALSQAAIYAAVAGVIGALFCLWLLRFDSARWLGNYLRAASLLGLFATALHFLLRVAALGGEWGAMWDPVLFSIVRDSVLGDRSLVLLTGFAVALAGHLSLSRRQSALRRGGVLLLMLSVLLLLYSFGLSGHLVEAHWLERLALRLHVLAMALWAGSLYPLLRQLNTSGADLAPARHNLLRFSHLATGIVGLLLVCGLWLALTLLNWQTLPAELSKAGSYAQMLAVKIALVALLLCLAAANKWRLVPALAERHRQMTLSVRGEVLLAAGILLVTAALAGLLSPGAH